MPRLKTPKGDYHYKLITIYLGWKPLDKVKAFDNLCLFKEICDRNAFRFFLAYGTLLGAMREKDFIAHDEDIDIGADFNDKDLFMSMLFELRENGFEVARWDPRGLLSIIRNNEYIDIYFFKKYNEKLMINCGEPLPRSLFENQTTIDFKGVRFNAPADLVGALEFWYGKDWQTPVQWLDFHMPKWKIGMQKIVGYLKCYMPRFIINGLLKKKEQMMFDKYKNRGVLDEYLD